MYFSSVVVNVNHSYFYGQSPPPLTKKASDTPSTSPPLSISTIVFTGKPNNEKSEDSENKVEIFYRHFSVLK